LFPAADTDDGSDSDEDDEEEEEVIPGSLQDILDGLENEKAKAVHEALNPPRKRGEPSCITVGEARERIDEASKPYHEKMDEARQEFVATGKMTAEEATATVGQSEEKKKEKRKAKRDLQKVLNGLAEERSKDERSTLDHDGTDSATVLKVLEEEMDKIRGLFERAGKLTAEEAKAIVPNVKDGIEDATKITKEGEGDGENHKDAGKKTSVPSRVVTEKDFPVTKVGMEHFIVLCMEVDKRDPDMHGMYIYNDYAGYGVREALENMVSQNSLHPKSIRRRLLTHQITPKIKLSFC
jgi:hypothetical protein